MIDMTSWLGSRAEMWPRLRLAIQTTIAACVSYVIVDAIGITSSDRILTFLPLHHANPQMYSVMSVLTAGCCIGGLWGSAGGRGRRAAAAAPALAGR